MSNTYKFTEIFFGGLCRRRETMAESEEKLAIRQQEQRYFDDVMTHIRTQLETEVAA